MIKISNLPINSYAIIKYSTLSEAEIPSIYPGTKIKVIQIKEGASQFVIKNITHQTFITLTKEEAKHIFVIPS